MTGSRSASQPLSQRAFVLALLGFLSACDQLGGAAKPEVPLWAHHPGTALSVDARRELSVKQLDAGEPYERSVPALDIAHRRLFIGSSDHGLYALSAATLTTAWRFETGGAVQGAPLYVAAEDAVYFGSNDGAVYKLRGVDGALQWRFGTNAEVLRKPVVSGKTLFATNANDTLVAIDKDSGKLRWFRQRTAAFGMEIAGYAGAAVHDGIVYTAFSDGAVMGYHVEDGSEAWPNLADLTGEAEQTSSSHELRYLDTDTTPVVAQVGGESVLFVASYEGGVFGLDPKTGGQLWRNEKATGVTELTLWQGATRQRVSPTEPVEPGVLIGSSGLTGLWGLNPSDGAPIWRRELPAGGATAAVPWAGALLIGTSRYGMFLVHPLDGSVLDGLAAGGSFTAAPAAYGRHAFALSNDGVLQAFGIEPPPEH